MGAVLDVDALPAGPALARQPIGLRRRFAAAGGDDYELCFTAPVAQRDSVVAAGAASGTAVTRVGTITSEPGLRLVDVDGAELDLQLAGWDHFSPG